jgi:hypothetical protein
MTENIPRLKQVRLLAPALLIAAAAFGGSLALATDAGIANARPNLCDEGPCPRPAPDTCTHCYQNDPFGFMPNGSSSGQSSDPYDPPLGSSSDPVGQPGNGPYFPPCTGNNGPSCQ